MNDFKVDDRVTWQDGNVQRIGFVGLMTDDGKAWVQDYATYTWAVDVSRLVPTPFTDEERAEHAEIVASWKAQFSR